MHLTWPFRRRTTNISREEKIPPQPGESPLFAASAEELEAGEINRFDETTVSFGENDVEYATKAGGDGIWCKKIPSAIMNLVHIRNIHLISRTKAKQLLRPTEISMCLPAAATGACRRGNR